MLNPKKVVLKHFFITAFLKKTRFCDQKGPFLIKNYILAKNESQSAIFDQKRHIIFHKNVFFFLNGRDHKMFKALFLESAYFSDAKTTFGMFGMIFFGVDFKTHSVCDKVLLTIW
jgi:hypothetical protein